MACVKKDLKDHLVSTPLWWAGPVDQAAQSHMNIYCLPLTPSSREPRREHRFAGIILVEFRRFRRHVTKLEVRDWF